MSNQPAVFHEHFVQIDAEGAQLEGDLVLPGGATGVVLFAHGSGSSRHSPRNRAVARYLNEAGLGTLLFDLLTLDEEMVDQRTARLRFDIELLASRLVGATDWAMRFGETTGRTIGYFGASTGGGAALVAAARRRNVVRAVVSRGGRPDLAGDALEHVSAPTLLIVGELDVPVIEMNRRALRHLAAPLKDLVLVPGATHLFEEPGTLEQVAELSANWFNRYLVSREDDRP